MAGKTVHVRASIGVAVYPNDGADPDELLRKADQAMHAAKHRGGNDYRFHRTAPP